jgi:hypothetical protein
MKLSEFLNDESKWTKGLMWGIRNEDGSVSECAPNECATRFCLLGASAVAASYPVTYIGMAIERLFPDRVVYLSAGRHYGASKAVSLVQFNDHPDTTFADVRAVVLLSEELAKTAVAFAELNAQ